MSAELSDKVLVCTSPALAAQLDEYADLKYQGKLDYNYHLSFEMMDFLVRYARGGYNGSDLDKRCYKIATRKGCYKEILISPFGPFTPAGEIALHNARILDGKLKRYYERIRRVWLTPDTVQHMDEIVPYGSIPGYATRMLRFLAELRLPEIPASPVPMPVAWHMATVELEGDHYILMGSIRNNMYARNAADTLLKFGLTELVSLPKSEHSQGKGRAPVGIKLTEIGSKFFASYQAKFDPGTVFTNRLAAERAVLMGDTAPIATSSPQSNSLRHAAVEVIYDNDPRSIVGETNPFAPVETRYDPTAPIETTETPETAEPDEDQLTSPDFEDQLSTGGQSAKTSSRRVSESSDVVAGEDLRELFG